MTFLQWATKLPPLWEAKPLKAVASYAVSNVDKIPAEDELPVRLCNYTDVYKNEFISPEIDLMQATATASEITKFCLKKNDVIITKDSESWDDIAIPALVVNSANDLLCGYHLAILRPTQDVMIGRFLFRCLQSKAIRLQLELASTGVTRFGLPKDEIGKLLLPIPPLKAQYHIADYLDAETAQIDALVAEKERMLALLEEKQAALISRAVTRSLDPNVPLKPSGLEWLGDIPRHWIVRRCATLFDEIDERNQPDLPLLNVSLNTGVTQRIFSNDKIESVAEDFTTYKVARKGDLVFNKMCFWQGAAGIAPINGLTSPDYTVARIKSELLPTFIELVVRLPLFSNEVRRYSYGMVDDRLRLYWNGFKDIRIPVPPLNEQNAIVAFLDRENTRTTELQETLHRSITLLKERRSALITAAVTGQLQIPDNQSSQ